MNSTVGLSSNVRRICSLYTSSIGSSQYIGEDVSILDHSLQAAHLAKKDMNDDIEFFVSCLLHDIGHLIGIESGEIDDECGMDGCGMNNHEHVGADFVKQLGFSPRVQDLIANHVSAKRYLCFKDVNYYKNLSEASKTTLRYQGNAMTALEAVEYESNEEFENYIRMRRIDENAKKLDSEADGFSNYYATLTASAAASSSVYDNYLLSKSQLNFYNKNGYLKVKNLFDYLQGAFDISTLLSYIDDISQWPKCESEGKYLIHHELVDSKPQLLRIENFVKYHDGIRSFVKVIINSICSQLFQEDAVLFKEKINFKLSGGAGFASHQDTPAYIGLAEEHISCMVCIDPSTIENGCLQVSPGRYSKGEIPLTSDGVITASAESQLVFRHIECKTGDLVFFDGYLPHRSHKNASLTNRRAMFLTYNKAVEGNFHEEYYDAKHSRMRDFDSSKSISFQGDFQGVVV